MNEALACSELRGLYFTTTFQIQMQQVSKPKANPDKELGKQQGKVKTEKVIDKSKVKKEGLNKQKLHLKAPDGRSICFKYGKPNGQCSGDCGMAHICQRCFGAHPYSDKTKCKGH